MELYPYDECNQEGEDYTFVRKNVLATKFFLAIVFSFLIGVVAGIFIHWLVT